MHHICSQQAKDMFRGSTTTRAGTRQGDPLSPSLFSLVASFVIFPLQDLDPGLTVMLYADDLIIFLDGWANPQLLGRIWKVVSCFGHFSGLRINLDKTAAIVQSCGGQAWVKCFGDIGVEFKISSSISGYAWAIYGNTKMTKDGV